MKVTRSLQRFEEHLNEIEKNVFSVLRKIQDMLIILPKLLKEIEELEIYFANEVELKGGIKKELELNEIEDDFTDGDSIEGFVVDSTCNCDGCE